MKKERKDIGGEDDQKKDKDIAEHVGQK